MITNNALKEGGDSMPPRAAISSEVVVINVFCIKWPGETQQWNRVNRTFTVRTATGQVYADRRTTHDLNLPILVQALKRYSAWQWEK